MKRFPYLVLTSWVLLIAGGANNASVSSVSSTSPAKTNASNNQLTWESLDSEVSIDGTKTVSTQIFSDDGSASLHLRKKGKHVELFMVPREFVGAEGCQVRWKIDRARLHTEEWSGSEDGTALFSSRPYLLLQALEHAGSGHTLQIEYKPYEYGPKSVSFSLPSTVPNEFARMADPIVAADEKEASVRKQYESCMADNSKRGADCVKILNDNGYSYPPHW